MANVREYDVEKLNKVKEEITEKKIKNCYLKFQAHWLIMTEIHMII